MDEERISELERLLKRCTPGRWENVGLDQEWEEDAEFIITACNEMPDLLAYVRDLEKQARAYRRALAFLHQYPNAPLSVILVNEPRELTPEEQKRADEIMLYVRDEKEKD